VDHEGILDFYAAYKEHCQGASKPGIHADGYHERVVPIVQALLADPVVDSFQAARQTLEAMLGLQKEYLGYLK
jgi:hypothetical protein